MIRRKGKGKGKGKGTCNLCGAPDHWQDQCPLNQGKGRPAPVRTTQHASPLQRTWWTGPTFLLGFITCCMPEFQLSSGLIFASKETIVFPWSERLFTTTTDFDDLYSSYLKSDYVSTYSMKPMNVWNDPDNYYWKESRWIMPDTPLIDSVSTAANDKIKTTQVLVFSQLGDNETWQTSWRTLLEYHGHALLMDTGAAKNLAGSYTLKDYEVEYLLPYNEYIRTEPSTASFTGISGTSQRAKVMTDSPVYPGGALGKMRISHTL